MKEKHGNEKMRKWVSVRKNGINLDGWESIFQYDISERLGEQRDASVIK